jgi:DNA-binding response OmpR family regulator
MSHTILIIDDDIDTLKLVGLMLERQGYAIAVASSGEQGLARARSEKPDLILLDIMMPELDGYEVCRRLRSEKELAEIPIIMFTAKTMVDDKVAGFEAGADDYITKPTHPAELTAHVKAILARSEKVQPVSMEKASILAFLGARAGLGTTTLALNMGVAFHEMGIDPIVAELNPGHGTMALELNLRDPPGLGSLLSRPVNEIHLRSVETALVTLPSGIRILPASSLPSEIGMESAAQQMQALVSDLTSLCRMLILDLGATLRPYTRPLLQACDHIVLVVEPVFPCTAMAKLLLDELLTDGIGRKKLSLALVTRSRTTMTVPLREVEEDIRLPIVGVIPPAPEQTHHAAKSGEPLLVLHKGSVAGSQLIDLAHNIAKQLNLPTG